MNGEETVAVVADDVLWRRVTTPDWIKITDGARRVSSAAFKGHENDLELSTHLAKLTTLEWVFGSQPEALAVAEILARHPLELGLTVEHDPEPDDYSHAIIQLSTEYGTRKKHAKRMASNAFLIHRPVAKVAAGEIE